MDDNSLKIFLKQYRIPYDLNVPLSQKTWIRQGGTCRVWIIPHDKEQLKNICHYLFSSSIKFDIIGQTSNIFFHSSYNPDVIVLTTHVNGYVIDDDTMNCDCGVSVVKLAKECLSKGYAGFYGLVGLPGTVASAIVNNASCFGCSLSSMLISADVLLPDGSIKTLSKDNFHYSHRSSAFKRGEQKGIILSVKLKVEKVENVEEEVKRAEASTNYRKYYQEGYQRNLGSVFASRKMKKNAKNIIAMGLSRIISLFRIMPQRKAKKLLLLKLYGYQDLTLYVSDKNINTYVWRDERAETLFARYKQFVHEVFANAVIEIEERQ